MGLKVNRFFIGPKGGYNTAYFIRVAKICPVSSTALVDGSYLICKAGGTAWFAAPTSTQISVQWANGQYNSTAVGDKCCVSEWGTLGSLLSACQYTPTEWFVPSQTQLQNPGYTCRANWSFTNNTYRSSTEFNATNAGSLCFLTNCTGFPSKSTTFLVRAFRCVTY